MRALAAIVLLVHILHCSAAALGEWIVDIKQARNACTISRCTFQL